MAIQIDISELADMIESLNHDVGGACCASSHYVGKLSDDKIVKITVMDAQEAEDDGYDDCRLTPLIAEV